MPKVSEALSARILFAIDCAVGTFFKVAEGVNFMENLNEEEIHLRDYWKVISKRRILIWMFFFAHSGNGYCAFLLYAACL